MGGGDRARGTGTMFKGFGSIGNLFGTSGPTLNYEIGEPYSKGFGSWAHYRGTSKDDARNPVSIFKFTGRGLHSSTSQLNLSRV